MKFLLTTIPIVLFAVLFAWILLNVLSSTPLI
jgi:hypothetical protein